jgi:hypothetical protein
LYSFNSRCAILVVHRHFCGLFPGRRRTEFVPLRFTYRSSPVRECLISRKCTVPGEQKRPVVERRGAGARVDQTQRPSDKRTYAKPCSLMLSNQPDPVVLFAANGWRNAPATKQCAGKSPHQLLFTNTLHRQTACARFGSREAPAFSREEVVVVIGSRS